MATTRAPAGAARPSERVDTAIRKAVLEELTDVGFAATSMEAVARRAGVGKAALYRRWPSKRDMLLSLLSEFSGTLELLPDTGSLFGDLVAYLQGGRKILGERARVFLPELIVIGARDQDFRETVEREIYAPRRLMLTRLFAAGVARGELPPDADLDSAMDLLVGGGFWRYTVKRGPLSDHSTERLAAAIVRAAGGQPPTA